MTAAYSFGAPGVKHSDRMAVLAEPRVGTLSCPSMKLRLASASPRRRELLDAIGLGFEVIPAGVDEQAAAGTLPPIEAATAVATAKAHAIPPRDGTVVLAADTMVVLDDRVIGKPADDADAQRMLASCAGGRTWW
jgi:septum formation protein